MKKTILITGGAGFIGSHLTINLVNKHPDVLFINLDKLTYAGNTHRLKTIENASNYMFVKGDICDQDLVNKLFSAHDISGVYHLAAESHVDNSINNPGIFIKTNVEGTFNLLEAAKNNWYNRTDVKFLHVSTDEVFGSLGDEGFFSETTPYAPNSPYSASKAASDFIARSYYHTYKLPVVISNCSNNYGPMQHDEKLMPTVIRKALKGEAIPIYGTGKNVRDWLFASDHCEALEAIFDKGDVGESYNIGTNNEKTNIEIATEICMILDNLLSKEAGYHGTLINFVEDRKGHDYRYAIDASKIKQKLGWQATTSFERGLETTVKWYVDYYGA